MNKQLEQNATFVGGHRKSVTTMLISLLEGHPQLGVYPPDSGFFYAYYPIYESFDYTNEERENRIIEFCYGNLKQELEIFLNKLLGLDDLKLDMLFLDQFY